MTKDQVKAVLERIPTWPEDRQQELAEIALEVEAELAGTEYDAMPDELAPIDQGLSGEAASEEEVEAAFALFGSNNRCGPSRIFDKSLTIYARSGNPRIAERI